MNVRMSDVNLQFGHFRTLSHFQTMETIKFIFTASPSVYAPLMLPVISEMSAFISVLSAVYVFVIIPANAVILLVIQNTKKLWTASNIVLALNGFFQIIGSIIMLFARLSAFPVLLFDEEQRRVWYTVQWWAFCTTFRISCTRYDIKAYSNVENFNAKVVECKTVSIPPIYIYISV